MGEYCRSIWISSSSETVMNWVLPVTGLVAQPAATPAAAMPVSHMNWRRLRPPWTSRSESYGFMRSSRKCSPASNVPREAGCADCEHVENDKRNAEGCQTRSPFGSEEEAYSFVTFCPLPP